MTKVLTAVANKMFVHIHKYRTVFKALCLLIFLLVCILLRYYLWIPGSSNFDLSKPVRISDLDAVCASMRRQYQAGQATSRQRTEAPAAQKRIVPMKAPSIGNPQKLTVLIFGAIRLFYTSSKNLFFNHHSPSHSSP